MAEKAQDTVRDRGYPYKKSGWNVRRSSYYNIIILTSGLRFRWVACQLDLLENCFTLPQLHDALASLPKTLDDTYARILDNIDKNYSHCNREILKILQWLTFSARPLRLGELAEIVAIDVHKTPRFDPERRWPEPREITAICSSLVTLTAIDDADSDFDFDDDYDDDVDYLTEESGSASSEGSQDLFVRRIIRNSPSKDSMYVRLAHFSVKEYLVSDRIQQSIAIHYSVQEMVSHGVLAEDCIAYLLQFDNSDCSTREISDLYPFADYAATFWAYHAKQAERIPIKSTSQMAVDFLQSNGGGLLSWIRIADPDQSYRAYRFNSTLNERAPPIYYASLVGLQESVRILIQRGTDVKAQGGCYSNALQAASYSGHEDIVQILLDSEADVNAHGGVFGNALQAASYTGYMEIVQVLLNKGADVNVPGGLYANSLNAACMNGSEDLVRLLLDKGAEINAIGPRGSALQLASDCCHENVVKMLLNKGADINAIGPEGSALQLASMRCHEDVVKMLLDKGAEVNAVGPRGTALRLASMWNNESVVKMLLEHGADLNADPDDTAVQAAFRTGQTKIVEMLVANGAVMPEERGQSSSLETAEEEEGGGEDSSTSRVETLQDPDTIETPSVQPSSSVQN